MPGTAWQWPNFPGRREEWVDPCISAHLPGTQCLPQADTEPPATVLGERYWKESSTGTQHPAWHHCSRLHNVSASAGQAASTQAPPPRMERWMALEQAAS